MKKIVSLILISLIIFSAMPQAFAQNTSWQEKLEKTVLDSKQSNFLLMDVSGDGIPEAFCPYGEGVSVYHYNGSNAVLAAKDAAIPFDFVKKLIRMRNKATDEAFYFGQTMHMGKNVTYKMSFVNCAPVLEIISRENPSSGDGTFKGSGATLEPCEDVSLALSRYLEGFSGEHFITASMNRSEMQLYTRKNAVKKLFERYSILASFSDDGVLFSSKQREEIKVAVGKGQFLSFDKISVLNDDVIFVEYYANNTSGENIFSYSKRYALVSGSFELIESYSEERELDPEFLKTLFSPDKTASNFNPQYDKTASFRGIDDYVNYFSSLLSEDVQFNENAKKEIASFMEYAVNKCSRAEVKGKANVFTVKKGDVAIIAQNAVNSMGQLTSVCESKGIKQLRTAKTVPELVCVGLDFEKPVRIEFDAGVSESIGQASGIKIVLGGGICVYINAAELSVLESEIEVFAIEFTKNENDYSIVFTDKNNEDIPAILMPVWFSVPAKSNYSSVLASFDGGTENRGGQFDSRFDTIEFSAVRSGNYQVVEEDITINDIDSVSFSANQAIRFLVSKGILDVDKKNNFSPKKEMSRYDFTEALVRMFYSVDETAACTYSDVDEKSEYYPFVATAEKMGITRPQKDNEFAGSDAVTNEYMMFLCGKILAEKKGYKFPENYVEYLAFSDKTEITATAMPYIAVAVQCGLTENRGEFSPDDFVTKEEGAQVLYKTFTLLYDTSPVTTSFSAVVEQDSNTIELHDLTPIERAIVCFVLTAILILGFYILYKTRKKEE